MSERKFELFCAIMWESYGHPAKWPVPEKTKPWFWERTQRRKERELMDISGLELNVVERDRFWQEVRKGQDVHEDAGGALIRHYRAMFGLVTPDVRTQARALAEMLDDAKGQRRPPSDWDATR
jgi:hypothetical protein